MKRLFLVTGLSAIVFLLAVDSVNISNVRNIIVLTAAVAIFSAAVRGVIGISKKLDGLELTEIKAFLEISVSACLSVCICGSVYLHKLNNYNYVIDTYDGQTVNCTLQIITEERFTDSGYGYFDAVPISGIDTNGYSVRIYGYGLSDAEVYDYVMGEFQFTSAEDYYYLANRADGIVLTSFTDDLSVIEQADKPFNFIFVKLKRYVEDTIVRYFGESQNFIKALILGDRSDMSSEGFDSLRGSGLLHVTAVSGLHVCLAAAFAMCVFSSVKSVYIRYLGIFTVIFILAGITGFSPSVIRSVFMISLAYIGNIMLRKTDSLNILGLVLTLYLFVSPFSVHSASLLLSFGASLGIILFSNVLQTSFTTWYFKLRGKYLNVFGKNIVSVLAVSISGTVITIPISLFLFDSVSVAGIFSNIFCLWLIKYIFIFSAVVIVLGWIPFLSPLFSLISVLVNWGVLYIMKVSDIFSNTVLSNLSATPMTVIISAIGGYLIYVLLGIKKKNDGNKRRKYFGRVSVSVIVSLVIFVAMALSSNIIRPSDNLLHIVFEDVGQGLASYISYNENAVVFDCGGSKDSGGTLKESLKEHGIQSIDRIIISHCHDDHMNGISDILSEWEVSEILIPYTENNGENYLRLKKMADAFGVSLIEVSGDKSFSFGEITVDLLFGHTDAYSEDFNEACIVSLVKFGEFKALFTGDITAVSEHRMIDCYGLELSVSLMSVPHHGSNSSSCPEFIGVVDPEFSVISVGKNSYGEPDSSVISRLLDYGEVYNTMIHGAVEFVTDGVSVEVVE